RRAAAERPHARRSVSRRRVSHGLYRKVASVRKSRRPVRPAEGLHTAPESLWLRILEGGGVHTRVRPLPLLRGGRFEAEVLAGLRRARADARCVSVYARTGDWPRTVLSDAGMGSTSLSVGNGAGGVS